MKKIDYRYLCCIIGNLAGTPIRIYVRKKQIFYHSIVNLPQDPIKAYESQVLAIDSHIGYYITPSFHYYGVVNGSDMKIILGPSISIKNSDQTLRELAFKCGVNESDTENFIKGMRSIVPMPLDSIIQILCTINYIVNDEKLGLKDIMIYDDQQQKIRAGISKEQAERSFDGDFNSDIYQTHNTLYLEEKISDIVRNGQTAELKKWIESAPAVRSGTLAYDMLRQTKNTFIVTATIISRAAINGGMDTDNALSLSDAYIQKCELINDMDSITNLMYHMVIDYTERVEKLRQGKTPSKFVLEVKNYISRHLSEQITTEKIAKALFMSRSRLSVKFKQQTGEKLIDFILKEKIEEAKHLLRYTDKTAVAISNYLGFSSQSHFTRVFKKYCNVLPNEYRKKYSL